MGIWGLVCTARVEVFHIELVYSDAGECPVGIQFDDVASMSMLYEINAQIETVL